LVSRKSKAGLVVCAVGLVAIGVFILRAPSRSAFPRLVWTRDPHCSAGDAWRAIGGLERLWERIGEISDDITFDQSDPAGYELASTPAARKFWIPRGNRLDLAEVLGEQEEDVYALHGRGVRRGDVVLDCGANVGAFTQHALEAGARRVVAIEPAPENLECLRRTFASEIQAGRVILYPKGVWDHDDTLVVRRISGQSGGDSVAIKYPGSEQGPTVPLTTIDKLVEELKLDRVDYIKMDIEGAEKNALRGAKSTVARFKPRMAISTEHLPDDVDAIPALIERLWPGSKTECGPCVWVKTGLVNRVRPDVVFVSR
jgi:FkbM family methyltransferase